MVSLGTLANKPGTRRWGVFRLEGGRVEVHREAAAFQRRLQEALAVYYEQTAFEVIEHQESLWAKLDIYDERTFRSSKIFVVHPPHSRLLFMTRFPKGQFKYIEEAIRSVFSCDAVSPLEVQGQDLSKLTEIALEKLSLGAFSSYRLCASLFDSDPLGDQKERAKRRRIVIEQLKHMDENDEAPRHASMENARVVAKSQPRKPLNRFCLPSSAAVDSGLSDDQHAGFKSICIHSTAENLPLGGSHTSSSLPKFSCFVKLDGHNVLRGLEALYEHDLVVDEKEVPSFLDANELMNGKVVGSRDENSAGGNNVLWLKTT